MVLKISLGGIIMHEFPDYYERNLPHWQPKGATLFFTYRLAGSLPKSVLEKLRREKDLAYEKIAEDVHQTPKGKELRDSIKRSIFLKYEEALESQNTGPQWLDHPTIAELVSEAILHRHNKEYDLVCFSIMSNHVHQLTINTRSDLPIYKAIGELKKWSGRNANEIVGRRGKFWQRESFDHVVRNGRMGYTIKYILNNPVKAGLVQHWRQWPHSWLNPKYCLD